MENVISFFIKRITYFGSITIALYTAQKMKFYMKDFFSNCEANSQFPSDLVTFTEEILNGKLIQFDAICLASPSNKLSNNFIQKLSLNDFLL